MIMNLKTKKIVVQIKKNDYNLLNINKFFRIDFLYNATIIKPKGKILNQYNQKGDKKR